MTTDNQRGDEKCGRCGHGHDARGHDKKCSGWDFYEKHECDCPAFQPSDEQWLKEMNDLCAEIEHDANARRYSERAGLIKPSAEGRGAAPLERVEFADCERCGHSKYEHGMLEPDPEDNGPTPTQCEQDLCACDAFKPEVRMMPVTPAAKPEPAVGVEDVVATIRKVLAAAPDPKPLWLSPLNWLLQELLATPPPEPAKGGEGAFVYLLNAMENASQADSPFEHEYSEKRKAVLAYVDRLANERDEAIAAEIERLEREVEQQRVQMAGVSVAALGGTTEAVRVEQGQYGWSPAYQDTLNLRLERDRLAAELAEAKAALEAKRLTISEANDATEEQRKEKRQLQAKLAEVTKERDESYRDACDLAAESWGLNEELAKCRAALSASPEGGKP